jgi:hypothetical protein
MKCFICNGQGGFLYAEDSITHVRLWNACPFCKEGRLKFYQWIGYRIARCAIRIKYAVLEEVLNG